MENKIVLFGPYIGDWKQELISFRPYINWIKQNLNFADYYISTHFNRMFLYDFAEINKFPIYEILTRDEQKQNGITHSEIHIKEYTSIILKKIRSDIAVRTGFLKKDILQYNLSYIKSNPSITNCNKYFSPIKCNKNPNQEKIVFIPDISCNKSLLYSILNHLEKKYSNEFVVIGDKKTYFHKENVIMKRIDYFEQVYKMSVDYITNAKMVICPCSHWTVLANQQKTPVFSWNIKNSNISQYKTNGIYGLGNANSIVDINRKQIKTKIFDQIDHSIENLIDKGVKNKCWKYMM